MLTKRRFSQPRPRPTEKGVPQLLSSVLSSMRSRSSTVLTSLVLFVLVLIFPPPLPFVITPSTSLSLEPPGPPPTSVSASESSASSFASSSGNATYHLDSLLSDPSVLLTRPLTPHDVQPLQVRHLLTTASSSANAAGSWRDSFRDGPKCSYAAVLQSDLPHPPPFLLSHFVPRLLNQSTAWCVFICASSVDGLSHWRPSPDHNVDTSRLFLYSPSELRALAAFRSSAHVAEGRVTAGSLNMLYLCALARGTVAVFDASAHMRLRNAARMGSLAYNVSRGEQLGVIVNSSCKSSSSSQHDKFTFVNPWSALRPMRLADMSESHARTWPRGMPAPDVRQACGRDLLHNKRFDWAAIPAALQAPVDVVATAVDGVPDVDAGLRATQALPLAFLQDNVVVAAHAPFGGVGVMWGRRALPMMYTPSSGTVAPRAAAILRALVAMRVLPRARQGFGAVVAERDLDKNGFAYMHDEPRGNDAEEERDSAEVDLALALTTPRLSRYLQREWGVKISEHGTGNENENENQKMTVGKALVRAWDALRMRGVVGREDVEAVADWVSDVAAVAGCDALSGKVHDGGDGKVDVSMSVCSHWARVSAGLDASTSTVEEAEAEAVEDGDSKPPDDMGRSRREPNVAVCVSGQLRSLTLRPGDKDHGGWYQVFTPLRAPNDSVADSIHRVLYPRLGSPDVFMAVSTRGGQHEPKVGDTGACEPLKPRKGGGMLSCNVVKERAVPVYKNDTLWEQFAQVKLKTQPRERVVQGMLQQLKGMYECYQMIAEHEGRVGKKYDWIARLRPDMYFHSFPSLATLAADSKGSTVWYANKDTCCCGNEDTFGIGPAHIMARYLERFTHLQQRDWWFIDHNHGWSGESYTQIFVELSGGRLEPHPDIQSCIIKPKRRVFSSEP